MEAQPIDDLTPYPYYVFFILGNEFCERYAYYGMRSILVLFLTSFLGFDKDTGTVIYHIFAALCYFFPLIGGIIADSYWGKFKTIFIVSIVYAIGMIGISVSAIPQINDGQDVPGAINDYVAMFSLLVIAIGTGGIKPCVSALGGDQFSDNDKGQEQLKGFFSLFYASINAGSLLSTFISPILRETQCFNRPDCYFIAFIIPAGLMIIAIGAFVVGKRWYIMKKPSGNVFAEFCSATWNGLRNKCKSKEEKEHFLDFVDEGKYEEKALTDFKYVYPLIIMYLPMPFFWALFDMQGSRFVLSALQMDGYVGSAKIKPDQMQILNPVMILAFLPIFQSFIYPLIEKCGIKMTALRKMSAGQIIVALAFMVAGFVQIAIDDSLTRIPVYGSQNSMMVSNGFYGQELTVNSDYWKDLPENYPEDQPTEEFVLSGENWRTPTYDWLQDQLPLPDTFLDISLPDEDIKTGPIKDFYVIPKEKITSFLCYEKLSYDENLLETAENVCDEYDSPMDKSSSIRVRAVLLNPTKYYAQFLFIEFGDDQEIQKLTNDTTVFPYKNSINSGTEFERGIYRVEVNLFDSEDRSNAVKTCTTEWVQKDPEGENEPENFIFDAGAIFTFVVRTDSKDNNSPCTVDFDRDSNGNTVNIFYLVPQYFVITVGEVMNSVTGLEFSYTQAPKSMKSVVQSFWLLTTCIGNIIDVFFVEIKLAPTQSGEYFILAAIMLGASGIFVLLSIFYYEYVPEGTFLDAAVPLAAIEKDEKKLADDAVVNESFKSEQKSPEDGKTEEKVVEKAEEPTSEDDSDDL